MPNVLLDTPADGYITCIGLVVKKDATQADQGGDITAEGGITSEDGFTSTGLDTGDGQSILWSGAEWTTAESIKCESIDADGRNLTHIRIPTYANNSDALTGGLVAGDVYAVTATGVIATVTEA